MSYTQKKYWFNNNNTKKRFLGDSDSEYEKEYYVDKPKMIDCSTQTNDILFTQQDIEYCKDELPKANSVSCIPGSIYFKKPVSYEYNKDKELKENIKSLYSNLLYLFSFNNNDFYNNYNKYNEKISSIIDV